MVSQGHRVEFSFLGVAEGLITSIGESRQVGVDGLIQVEPEFPEVIDTTVVDTSQFVGGVRQYRSDGRVVLFRLGLCLSCDNEVCWAGDRLRGRVTDYEGHLGARGVIHGLVEGKQSQSSEGGTGPEQRGGQTIGVESHNLRVEYCAFSGFYSDGLVQPESGEYVVRAHCGELRFAVWGGNS